MSAPTHPAALHDVGARSASAMSARTRHCAIPARTATLRDVSTGRLCAMSARTRLCATSARTRPIPDHHPAPDRRHCRQRSRSSSCSTLSLALSLAPFASDPAAPPLRSRPCRARRRAGLGAAVLDSPALCHTSCSCAFSSPTAARRKHQHFAGSRRPRRASAVRDVLATSTWSAAGAWRPRRGGSSPGLGDLDVVGSPPGSGPRCGRQLSGARLHRRATAVLRGSASSTWSAAGAWRPRRGRQFFGSRRVGAVSRSVDQMR